jgi:hypothetical protein
LGIDANLFVELSESGVRPFGSLAVFLLFCVFDKVLRVLIDTEVGKMHVSFFDILHFGIVLMGSKPGESFVEHVNSQRIVTGDKNINSQIILEPIDEMRVMNVL